MRSGVIVGIFLSTLPFYATAHDTRDTWSSSFASSSYNYERKEQCSTSCSRKAGSVSMFSGTSDEISANIKNDIKKNGNFEQCGYTSCSSATIAVQTSMEDRLKLYSDRLNEIIMGSKFKSEYNKISKKRGIKNNDDVIKLIDFRRWFVATRLGI